VKACFVIPLYQHRDTIAGVLEGVAKHDVPGFVIDDGSDPATRDALASLGRSLPWLRVHHLPHNCGKGAALRTGFRLAAAAGYSHAVQLDADAQHDPADLPRFLSAMRRRPYALVLGEPVFDASVPRLRLWSRQISRSLVWLATLSRQIHDPLCGYRGVPLGPTLRLLDQVRSGDHMDFDPELAVRLCWAGHPIVNLPTRVVYPPGGLSHFDLLRDNLRLAWLYIRLLGGMLKRAPKLRGPRTREAGHG